MAPLASPPGSATERRQTQALHSEIRLYVVSCGGEFPERICFHSTNWKKNCWSNPKVMSAAQVLILGSESRGWTFTFIATQCLIRCPGFRIGVFSNTPFRYRFTGIHRVSVCGASSRRTTTWQGSPRCSMATGLSTWCSFSSSFGEVASIKKGSPGKGKINHYGDSPQVTNKLQMLVKRSFHSEYS